MSASIVLVGLAAVLGLLIGSFLNVVVYRVPAGLSVVSPASACPGCRTPIAPRDNIPVVSWIALRAKCRHCRMTIPLRYPAVEVVTSAAFALAMLPFAAAADRSVVGAADVLELVAFLYLAAISIALTLIDADVRRLPDAIVLPAYPVGLLLLGAADLLRGDAAAFAMACAGAGASVLLYAALWFARPGGMGLGDVKLAGVLGLYLAQLGVANLVVGVSAAFVLGGVFGAVLIATRRADRRSALPFGPWMLAGAWIGVVAGPGIAEGYLRVVGLA